MLGLASTMGVFRFCISTLGTALALLIVPNVGYEVGAGFLSGSLLQMPGFREVGPSLPFPFQLWNLMDIKSRFELRVMNSSWSGPAETNIYHKGDSVYLQASASVGADQGLYIQSCYATSSPNPMDKSRTALILNKGCVSSKQLMIEFMLKERDSINLLLDTSRLKFSQFYIHCSMVFSPALTLDAKSCNYNKNKSIWIELGGETSVCQCCASKCKGPPFYGGLKEFKAFVSTGPLFITENLQEEEPLSYSFKSTLPDGSSPGMNLNGSGMFPSSMRSGSIVASTTVSGNTKKVPYSSPWLSQPVMSDSMMVVGQDPGSALLMLLTGRSVDEAPAPVLKMVIDIPEEINVGEPSKHGGPFEKVHSKKTSEATHDLRSLTQELLGEIYMSDSPGMNWDLSDVPALEGFPALEEELRGDMFMSYKWPQQDHSDPSDEKVRKDTVTSPAAEKPSEKSQEKNGTMVLEQMEKVVKKVNGDELGKPEYIKRSKLMFSQAANGSSSLSYEEEERSRGEGEQEVTKNRLELEWTMVEEEQRSKDPEKQLMRSLLDLVRGLNETMTDR